ncbi:hypothetical protein JOC78_003561 [Bacillus ectoiniformans]|uniref:LamG domain-containing protein n=1 Tax=Bacillus ectoiniformans TaxID=1494429 RepID=UPI001958CA41|nr:LamG domain-containing protein [Bacillus ectoiniformans]MBM7650564.1 hypothetical protein [Bacillus ectoiniformans]
MDSADDHSMYQNHGTPFNVSYIDGKSRRAIQFGGVQSKGSVTIPANDSLNLTSEMTVSFWVKLNSYYGRNGDGYNAAKGIHAVFNKGQEGNMSSYIYTDDSRYCSKYMYDIRIEEYCQEYAYRQPAIDLWMTRTVSTMNPNLKVNKKFELGEWNHVAFVISPSTRKAYINGVIVTNISASPFDFSPSNNSDIIIGWLTSEWYALNGALDDFRMYKSTLTESDIQALYSQGL